MRTIEPAHRWTDAIDVPSTATQVRRLPTPAQRAARGPRRADLVEPGASVTTRRGPLRRRPRRGCGDPRGRQRPRTSQPACSCRPRTSSSRTPAGPQSNPASATPVTAPQHGVATVDFTEFTSVQVSGHGVFKVDCRARGGPGDSTRHHRHPRRPQLLTAVRAPSLNRSGLLGNRSGSERAAATTALDQPGTGRASIVRQVAALHVCSAWVSAARDRSSDGGAVEARLCSSSGSTFVS